MIHTKKIDYENFGRALRIRHENMEMVVTTGVGPRILFFGEKGGDNLLYNDLNRTAVNRSALHASVFGAGNPYYFYGGHRVWASPEHDPHSNCPDNAPPEVVFTENSVSFISAPQPVTGLQLSLTVIPEPGRFHIVNQVKNLSDDLKTLAAWGITQLAPGGRLIVPQNTTDTGLLPNRHMTVWPYTTLTDSRVGYGKEYIVVAHNPKVAAPYKLGIDNTRGWLAYLNKGYLFKKSFAWEENKVYPDNNVNCEFYLNGQFIEAECLSYLKVLGKNDVIEAEEAWALTKIDTTPDFSNENSISALIR